MYDLIQVGDTALHNAAMQGHMKVVDNLLISNAKIDSANNVSQFVVVFYQLVNS